MRNNLYLIFLCYTCFDCCCIIITLTIDYDSAGYSVTIGDGETEGSQNISITMDSISGEGDETFTNRIESVSAAGVTLGERESVVTIKDSISECKLIIILFVAAWLVVNPLFIIRLINCIR